MKYAHFSKTAFVHGHLYFVDTAKERKYSTTQRVSINNFSVFEFYTIVGVSLPPFPVFRS